MADEKGRTTDKYDYDAFGNIISSTGRTENGFLFAGEQFDSVTGLYYLRARYMDTSTGRFISMDTYQGSTADPISLHKYLYANSNPVTYSDPSGYMADLAVAGAVNAELHKADVIASSAALATGMKIISSLVLSLAVTNHICEQIAYIISCIEDIASGDVSSAEVNEEARDEAIGDAAGGAGSSTGGPNKNDDDHIKLIKSALKHAKTILEHFDKLSSYCKDPYSGDNLGKLATATEWVRQQMIDGRITSLLNKQLANQINNLNQVIEEIIEILKNM